MAGFESTGVFSQGGGTNTTPSLIVGSNTQGNGTYNLIAGQLSAATEWLGYAWGFGSFLQSGGTNTVSSSLLVGAEGAQNGTSTAGAYTLAQAGCPPPKKTSALTTPLASSRNRAGRIRPVSLTFAYWYNSPTTVGRRDVQSQRREAYRYVDRPRSRGGRLQLQRRNPAGRSGLLHDPAHRTEHQRRQRGHRQRRLRRYPLGHAFRSRQSDQGQQRHAGPDGREYLCRRHFPQRRHAATGKRRALGTGGLAISAGLFDLNTWSIAVLSLAGTAGTISDLSTTGSGTTTLSVTQSANTTFAGTIQDGPKKLLALSKSGAGLLTLSGTNTYTGPTTISQGKLVVDGSLTNSAVSVNGGTLGGTGYLNSVTVYAGGNLAPGDSLGALHLSGNLILESGAAMDYELDTPSTSDMISAGNLTLNSQQFSDFHFMWSASFAPGIYPLIGFASSSGSLGHEYQRHDRRLPGNACCSRQRPRG